MSILHAEHISIAKGGDGQQPYIMPCSLTLEQATCLCLLGPNGAGKSTLIKGLLGLYPLLTGTIQIEGHDLAERSLRERARIMAYVPQKSGLTFPLLVEEVVAQGRYPHMAPWDKLTTEDYTIIENSLQACDITNLRKRPFTALSSGEQQRVLIARALTTQAKIIILDEPAAGLDVRHCLGIVQVLKRLCEQGRTVIAAMHDLELTATLADSVCLLKGGACVGLGSATETLQADSLSHLYETDICRRESWSFTENAFQDIREQH